MMNVIGIIPKEPEIGCFRCHPCKPLHGRIRIRNALRVAVLRHAPDSFNRFILKNQLLNRIHIRTVRCQANHNHLDIKQLTDCKMPVIPGAWANEFHFGKLRPWLLAAAQTMQHRSGNSVVHHIQAGIAPMMTSFGLTPKISANNSFASGMPSMPP